MNNDNKVHVSENLIEDARGLIGVLKKCIKRLYEVDAKDNYISENTIEEREKHIEHIEDIHKKLGQLIK